MKKNMAINYPSATNQGDIYPQEPPPSSMMMYFTELSSAGSCFPDVEPNCQNQELSLSLSTQIPESASVASSQYQYQNSDMASYFSHHLPNPADEGRTSGNGYQNSQSKGLGNDGYLPSGFPEDRNYFKSEALRNSQFTINPENNRFDAHLYDQSSHTKPINNSKYVKAVRQLLDEVVSVQDALKKSEVHKRKDVLSNETNGRSNALRTSTKDISTRDASTSSCEMSPEERQELQNKKTKLMSMLEEVDGRFSQYYHQMHSLALVFDIIAGTGAAKPYTGLALKTISRYFRCLRDALVTQILEAKRSLGEQDASPNSLGAGIPRLRYVDQQIRQDRALQQLGVSRHSWRPQRGLPENSVSILRAWLFEHFLHPYPKESEKIMLARQTGLTRGQVANWFINARVRLWKPMVEEIYKEEFGDSEVNSTSLKENGSKDPKMTSWASEDVGQELLGSVTSMANFTSHKHHPFHESSSKTDTVPVIETSEAITGGYFHSVAQTDYRPMKLEGERFHEGSNLNLYPNEFISNQNEDGVLMTASDALYPTLRFNNLAMDNQVSHALVSRSQETDFLSMCSVIHFR